MLMADKEKPKQGRNTGNAGKGRPKGSPNKTTSSLKAAILLAAKEHGEDDNGKDGLTGYLRKIAREDVKAFAGLLGRVLPLTIAGDDDNPIKTVTRIELVPMAPSDDS